MIDGSTSTVVATIGVGRNPFLVGVNPMTDRINVRNDEATTITVIDGLTDTVAAAVPVGAFP